MTEKVHSGVGRATLSAPAGMRHVRPTAWQVVTDALDKPRVIKFKGALDLVTETDEASEKAVLEVRLTKRRAEQGWSEGGGEGCRGAQGG